MTEQPGQSEPRTGVGQTILASPENEAQGIYGNCLQAAFATLLNLPLDAVPHFAAFEDWQGALSLWLKGRGLKFVLKPPRERETPEGPYLVHGPSPRARSEAHICVAEDGEIVWDPHPSAQGLPLGIRAIWHVIPLDEEASDAA